MTTKPYRILGVSSCFLLCSCAYNFGSVESESDTTSNTTLDTASDTPSESEEDTDSDLCPSDPTKTEPGFCGCGHPDVDGDEDGVANCLDGCPSDPNKTAPGICGCNVDDDTCPGIAMAKSNFSVSEEIVLNYSGLPGNLFDWIGLYLAGAPNSDDYIYQFTRGKIQGTMRFTGLRPGQYEARLFFDDAYDLVYKTPFTVTQADNEILIEAAADTYVDALNANVNFGHANLLLVDTAPYYLEAIMRFSIPALTASVQNVALRFVSLSYSPDGPKLALTSNAWSEYDVTWNNRPVPSETIVADIGEVLDSSLQVDLTASLSSPGLYSLALLPDCDDGVDFMSRESSYPPYIVIVTGE